jgi:transcription elongation factor
VKQEREGLEVEQKEDIKRGMARVSLSLSNRENKTLVKIMEKTGLKRSQAFLSIFRAFHFNEPQFCAGEVGAINKLKIQLQAIGRNLNQIARKINTSLQDSDLMNAERVHDLSCALNSCIEPLSARMKSHRDRWAVIL